MSKELVKSLTQEVGQIRPPENKLRKWRRDKNYLGLRGRTEPNYTTGKSSLYGTGAEVCPLDDWQRRNFAVTPSVDMNYHVTAWFKCGNQKEGKDFVAYAKTAIEGMEICNRWLDEMTRSQ